MTKPEERRTQRFHQAGAAMALAAVVTLIAFDGDRTFRWVLARLLGTSLIWCGYAVYLWLAEQPFWNRFFAGGFLLEAALRLVDMTPFRYFPPLYVLLWVRGILIPLLYAGGIREATKERRGWSQAQATGVAVGGGLALHYVLVNPLLDAILTLLRGAYP